MVGQGVLRECLADQRISGVLALGRRPVEQRHAKLRNVVHANLYDLSPVALQLKGIEAVFFCLGVSSVGMSEADYRRVTHDLTLSVADTVLEQAGPDTCFVYVSGAATDSSETGRSMWARVKGETENELERRFTRAFMFRPGIIQPMNGATSRTGWVDGVYRAAGPLLTGLRRISPAAVTTTEEIGRAMIAVAAGDIPAELHGRRVHGNRDIHTLAR